MTALTSSTYYTWGWDVDVVICDEASIGPCENHLCIVCQLSNPVSSFFSYGSVWVL